MIFTFSKLKNGPNTCYISLKYVKGKKIHVDSLTKKHNQLSAS